MPWPAFFNATEGFKEGTSYIPSYKFHEALNHHGRRGQGWKFNGQFTTYCPSRSVSYKCVTRLFPTTEAPFDEKNFWQTLECIRAAELDPPTSFGDLWLDVYRQPMPRVSPVSPFYGRTFGGWQEARRYGKIPGRVYHYDLNKAYRWSACLGLPDLTTSYPTKDFTKRSAIYIVVLPSGLIPWHRAPGLYVLISEERDVLGLDSVKVKVVYGIAFSRNSSLTMSFDALEKKYPAGIVSKVSRAFWGLWNTRHGPTQCSWKHGVKETPRRNPWYNPIWSAYITSRVKMRVATFLRTTVHIHVDAIWTTEPIPTGEQPGDWKLLGQY